MEWESNLLPLRDVESLLRGQAIVDLHCRESEIIILSKQQTISHGRMWNGSSVVNNDGEETSRRSQELLVVTAAVAFVAGRTKREFKTHGRWNGKSLLLMIIRESLATIVRIARFRVPFSPEFFVACWDANNKSLPPGLTTIDRAITTQQYEQSNTFLHQMLLSSKSEQNDQLLEVAHPP